jgi:hypothetical protein
MKHLPFFALLLLAACGNHNSPARPTDTTTTTVATTPTASVATTTPAGQNNSVGVAITEFAEWQRGAQGNVDGEYDSQEGMFIPCGSDQGVAVQAAEVKPMSGGSCDGQGSKMEPERMVVIQRSGPTFHVISRDVTLQEVTKEKGAGEYKTAAGTQKIVIDPSTMNRIKARTTLMQHVIRK